MWKLYVYNYVYILEYNIQYSENKNCTLALNFSDLFPADRRTVCVCVFPYEIVPT